MTRRFWVSLPCRQDDGEILGLPPVYIYNLSILLLLLLVVRRMMMTMDGDGVDDGG